jgi:4-hydroxyproline epimerase
MQRIQVIDSHTGGEPTRLVIGGFPDLGGGSMAERRRCWPSGTTVARAARATSRAAATWWSARCCASRCRRQRLRRDLLQQRRLPGHVRPRHHRAGREPGAHGAHRRGEHRIETPVGTVTTTLHEDGR